MRRVGVGLIVALLVVTACTGDDGGAGDATSSSADDAFGRAMAAQWTDGVITVATSDAGGLTLETLSTRADAVSDGDVLVRVGGDLLADGSPAVSIAVDGEPSNLEVIPEGQWRIATDGQAVGRAGTGGPRVGLITRLDDGDHLIEATVAGEMATLAVTNHPGSGPVFAGAHLEPWICHTEEAGLGLALDEDCSVEAQRTTETVTPPEGPAVDVRMDRGVIDRGIYTMWMPADPNDWNGRLVYRFGGGCGTTYGQGFDLGTTIDADLLSRGYALATNTLDTFQTICNPMVSAEAALMTREQFIESYGVPEFTMGTADPAGPSSSSPSPRTNPACSTPSRRPPPSPTPCRSPPGSATAACSSRTTGLLRVRA